MPYFKNLFSTCLLALLSLFCILLGPQQGFSQEKFDSLAAFYEPGKALIYWKFDTASDYQDIKSIGIQRSADSTIFATVGQAQNPDASENSYLDQSTAVNPGFYRLFIFYKGGSFYFSPVFKGKPASPDFFLSKGIFKTDDQAGISAEDDKTAKIKAGFQPSVYVFTNEEGNVSVRLPDASVNNYAIGFFDEQDHFLFEISRIKKSLVIVDKVNFVHKGWFKYKLYRNNDLFEEWKFYISDTEE